MMHLPNPTDERVCTIRNPLRRGSGGKGEECGRKVIVVKARDSKSREKITGQFITNSVYKEIKEIYDG